MSDSVTLKLHLKPDSIIIAIYVVYVGLFTVPLCLRYYVKLLSCSTECKRASNRGMGYG
ncbi:hypothetical protein MNBD_GAMMA10-1050 [hydrothermal vent metagenome]|uniref:Uncharacterized protein n=1 Tax=hydrothermal vent metagenome TaxID=652676 RepID=A0A3B0Y894_9ZZZZ